MALELFGLQFEHNPAYRKICAAQQITPGTITDWRQIPAVPTAAFKEFELTCLPPQTWTTVFLSSGTTEVRPSCHFHNRESLLLYEQSVLTWFWSADASSALLPSREHHQCSSVSRRLLSLTPDKAAAPHSSLVHMFECIGNSAQFAGSQFFGEIAADGDWALDLPAVRDRLERAARQGEHIMVVGTAFSFVHLLDHLGEQKPVLVLPPGSRVLETGGYKGRSRSMPKSELHPLITARLGVPRGNIVCEYGMAELSSQAYDCLALTRATPGPQFGWPNVSRRLCFPPWARVQVVSAETAGEVPEGQVGLIRVFDLANVYSVLAIQTEDLAVRRGDGFELIGRANQAEPRGCSLMAVAP